MLVALLLITVFVCAYGVAVQSLIDPYRPNTLNHIVNGFTNAFSIAFFQVFGELQLEE